MLDFEGTEVLEEEIHGIKVHTVHVRSEQAAEKLKKSLGSYITIEVDDTLNEHTKIEDIGECLAEVLDRILQPYHHGKLCVCGIGNKDIPADALGPEVTKNLPLKVFSVAGVEGNFSEVCAITPGVPMTNNIDTEVIVKGVVKEIGADCALLVDSLVTNEPARLFRTIQLSSAGGLIPSLADREAAWSTLDIPVISVGVPLAILLSALHPGYSQDDQKLTGAEIHRIVAGAGRIIAYAILRACWPSWSKAECFVMSGINSNPIPNSFLLEGEHGER